MAASASTSIPTVARERLCACIAGAALLGALSGAAAGAAECLALFLAGEARYARWAAHAVGIAFGGYAALGALVALPCALVAWFLWRPPDHRAAPPSGCAGLGAFLGVAGYIAIDSVGTAALVPLALAGTLLALTLRELLAWWPLFGRPLVWWGAAVLLLALDLLVIAVSLGDGTARLSALLLGAASVMFVLTRRMQVKKFGTLPVSFGALVLPLAGLFVLARSPFPAGSGADPDAARATPHNVLLVTIDTLRADHLGCYGYASAKTPVIDALARAGCLFEDTTAQANTTNPSHTSILTGLYPAEHGALSNGHPMSGSVPTISDLLARAGYGTAAFVSGFALEHRACGLDRRFDWYDDRLFAWRWAPYPSERLRLLKSAIAIAGRAEVTLKRADRPAAETVDCALQWLERSPRQDRPFFLWVHLYDPHGDYEPPPPYDTLHDPDWESGGPFEWYTMPTEQRQELTGDERTLRHMVALYDGEISYADAQVGRLLGGLEELGLEDETLVVLTADHGEGLTSHGYFFDHGAFLYDDELHVPLIVRFPDGAHAGKRIAGQTRLIDVAPTVMEVLRQPSDARFTGASLLPVIEGAAPAGERPSFALADMSGSVSGFAMEGRRLSLRAGGHKLIWTSPHWLDTQRVPERIEFFDLPRDPSEEHDQFESGPESPEAFERMFEELDLWREATESAREDEPLSPEVIERLRSLGYL